MLISGYPASHHGKQGLSDQRHRQLHEPPRLVPAIEIGVIEPESGVHAVRPDGVVGRSEAGGAAFDYAGQKCLRDAFKRCADQVVHGGCAITVLGDVGDQVSELEVAGVDQAEQIFGVEVATR
jgi:hypothetical protein